MGIGKIHVGSMTINNDGACMEYGRANIGSLEE